MAIKEELIKLFDDSKGTFFSGEEIARTLNVSRNAVWKNVKSLQEEGYMIKAVTNKGYCLSQNTDILSTSGISKFLDDKNLKIQIHKTLTSTNTYLKEQNFHDDMVVLCENQTKGIGRMNRNFYSPASTGLYLSILLHPKMSAQKAVLITTMAAVAVCEAIEELSDKKAEIKWVNDIYINNKKVCGILTEASFNTENNSLEYVIVGIGINVFAPKTMPLELKDIITWVYDGEQKDIRNKLAAQVINRFMYHFNSQKEFSYEYKRRSCVIGKQITVIDGNNTYPATATDIDENCRLKITKDDGSQKYLSSGEISIRI